MDRGNLATRRNYVRRRKIGVWLVFLSFVLFLTAAFIIKDTSAPNGWMILATFGVFLVCCVACLSLTRCPFCGKTIVVGAVNKKNCPHCGKALTLPEELDLRARDPERMRRR